MKAIEKVTAHWATINEKKSIHVPEWEMDIFFTPLNMKQRSVIARIAEKDVQEAAIAVIIMKAQDADGSELFSLADKPILMRQSDPAVVDRIASAMFPASVDSEGN